MQNRGSTTPPLRQTNLKSLSKSFGVSTVTQKVNVPYRDFVNRESGWSGVKGSLMIQVYLTRWGVELGTNKKGNGKRVP